MPHVSVDEHGNPIQHGEARPALVLDLDGTVRRHKDDPNAFINDADDVALYDGIEERIWRFRRDGYLILGATNQGGVAFGHKTPQSFEEELDATLALFDDNPFHLVKCCYHHPKGDVVPYNYRSLLRKPDIGMLALMEAEAFRAGYIVEWDSSVFVGDREEDQECADRAEMGFIWAKDFRQGATS